MKFLSKFLCAVGWHNYVVIWRNEGGEHLHCKACGYDKVTGYWG